MDLSIIIPVYNEDESLTPLFKDLLKELSEIPLSAEIIFVDDGSDDRSAELLDKFAIQDPHVNVIHLRRNYGQTAAIMAGIRRCSGEVIIPMDGDGQNDPCDISRLIEKLAEGHDVVSGWRKEREDAWLTRKLPSRIANKIISSLMGVTLHDYGCTLKAYRRSVIEDVRLYGEMHRYIPVYAAWEGARVTELVVTHHPRRYGTSKYGLGRTVRVVLDVLLLYFLGRAFDRPIQFFGKVGLVSIGLALLAFATAVSLRIFLGVSLILTPLPLLAATLGLSGVLFLLLGVMAEVQVRTYYEAQGKEPYKIRDTADNLEPKPPKQALSSNQS